MREGSAPVVPEEVRTRKTSSSGMLLRAWRLNSPTGNQGSSSIEAQGRSPCGGAAGGVVGLHEEDGDPVVARHDGSPGRARQPTLDVVEVDPHPEHLADPLQSSGDVEEALPVEVAEVPGGQHASELVAA